RRFLRQVHSRVRALPVNALERHRAAVPLDDRAHDEEAEAEAALLRIFTARTVELLEQAGVLGILRAGSLVVDPEVEPAVRGGARTDRDGAVGRTELARIREQVHEHLREPL